MQFLVARWLGYLHPDRMLREMTAREWAEWRAALIIDPDVPFGPGQTVQQQKSIFATAAKAFNRRRTLTHGGNGR